MTAADLEPLRAELAHWRAAGRRARFWLRDDDAIAATPRLAAMSEVLQRFSLRALLAVIPALMEKPFAAAIADLPCYIPCQHGLRHVNHEPSPAPKSEFGSARRSATAVADIEEGYRLMTVAFGAAFTPIFVPPWNRITADLQARLPELGYVGLSAYASDEPRQAIPGLIEVDIDVDVLNWAQPEGQGVAVLPSTALATRLASLLYDRRIENPRTAAAPIGLLTHHRAMNQTAWEVVSAIVTATRDSGAAEWMDPSDLFDLNAQQTSPEIEPAAKS